MGAPQAVTIFNTQTGAVLQTYVPNVGGTRIQTAAPPASPIRRTASTCCSARTAITARLRGYVAIASVNATTGMLSDYAQVSVPMDVNADGYLTNVTCFPGNSPRRGPRAALTFPAATPFDFLG